MRLQEYPILKLLIGLVLGIIAARYFSQFTLLWYFVFPLMLMMGFLSWPRSYLFPYRFRYISGAFVYLLFIFFGFTSYQYHFDQQQSDYFGNHISTAQHVACQIIEPPQYKEKTIKLFVEIKYINDGTQNKDYLGEALIYLQKDSAALNLQYGDYIYFNKSLQEIPSASNPDQFDYKSYLALQDISYQVFLKENQWHQMTMETDFSIKKLALDFRGKLLKILQENNIQDDELSIAAGMLLGVRDMLSPELRQAYAGAGAMHILCVSGLHVGIIFMILNALLGFLSYRKRGKLTKAIIILTVIWLYALLTGLSPSVVRSATMFSFIVVGQNLNRHVNILSSLSSSALVLLIFNPTLLFDLGFQLSYAAVLAIVIIQKPIADLWTPNNVVLYKSWQLVAVSIAAQIGTAPISLYYFNQFPNLFIITNLIVIPAAYLIINMGIIVLLFSFIPPISAFLGKILSYFLFGLNYAITYIEQLNFAVTRDIYINPIMFVLLISLVIFTSIWLIQKRKKLIFVNLSLVLCILVAALFNYDLRDEFIIYQTNGNTYMAIYSNREAVILCDTAVLRDPTKVSFQTAGHELKKGIRNRSYYSLDLLDEVIMPNYKINYPFMKLNDIQLKIHDNTSVSYLVTPFDYLIYQNSKQKQIAELRPHQTAIICNNIPPWRSKPIEEQYDKTRVKTYFIKEEGAWILYF